MKRRSAIAWLPRPLEMSRSTSTSRGVSTAVSTGAALLGRCGEPSRSRSACAEVAGGDRNEPGGQACRRQQRRGLRVRGDAAELFERRACALEIVVPAERGVGADQQLERGGAFGAIPRRQPPQMPLGELRGALRITAVERDGGASQ